jgi:hypothetical protein
MQPPLPQPETTKTKRMSALQSMPALTKPTMSTNNSGNEGTLTQLPLPQPDTNNKKGNTTMLAATTKGNSVLDNSIAKTTMGAPIAATTMGTALRASLFQPPTLTNTNDEDTLMQPPLPQPETTEKKIKGVPPSTPALTQPTTATNNSNEGTSMQPPLPQCTKTTGNTSQDDSMLGTADGNNKVSIMVDKFFFPKWNKMCKLNVVTLLLH